MAHPLFPRKRAPSAREAERVRRGFSALEQARASAQHRQSETRRGGRTLVRPVVIGSGGAITSFQFNRVNSAAADTVYASDAGPLNRVCSGGVLARTEELWVKFPAPYPLNTLAVLLGQLSPGSFSGVFYGDGGGDVFGSWAFVTADWDPATLTWNNKPAGVTGSSGSSELNWHLNGTTVDFEASGADGGSDAPAYGDGFWLAGSAGSTLVYGARLELSGDVPASDDLIFAGWAASGLALYKA